MGGGAVTEAVSEAAGSVSFLFLFLFFLCREVLVLEMWKEILSEVLNHLP